MRIHTLYLLLFSASTAIAEPRDPREHGNHPRGCSQSLVDQCVLHYRRATDSVRSWLLEHEPKVKSLERELQLLNKNLSSISLEKNSIASDQAQLRSELKFLRAPLPEKTRGLLRDQISLENFFRMHPLHRGWRERYPEERAEKLSIALDEYTKKEIDLNARFARIEAEKTKRDNEYQSVVTQKNSWLAEARQHEEMCNSGCRERVCPSGF